MGMINLLTVEEVADLLKVSRQHIRRMIRERMIPAVKVGREWRIDANYLKEFLDENMV